MEESINPWPFEIREHNGTFEVSSVTGSKIDFGLEKYSAIINDNVRGKYDLMQVFHTKIVDKDYYAAIVDNDASIVSSTSQSAGADDSYILIIGDKANVVCHRVLPGSGPKEKIKCQFLTLWLEGWIAINGGVN